jgi:FlaA1/EpsC-like NDP-sugar epimerase
MPASKDFLIETPVIAPCTELAGRDKMETHTILVTGGAGFIGTNLVNEYVSTGRGFHNTDYASVCVDR